MRRANEPLATRTLAIIAMAVVAGSGCTGGSGEKATDSATKIAKDSSHAVQPPTAPDKAAEMFGQQTVSLLGYKHPDIHEWHDVQPLRRACLTALDKCEQYDPDAGGEAYIFATPATDGLTDPEQFAAGVLAAVVWLPEQGKGYPKLELEPGLNYVRIYYTKGHSPAWSATVNQSETSAEGAKPLKVTAKAFGVNASAVPGVVLWDWEPQRKRMLMAVKCANRFCYIGTGQVTAPPDPCPGNFEGEQQGWDVCRIRGYVDVQRLGDDDGNMTKITGTIIPVEHLGTKTKGLAVGTTVQVASIFVSGGTYRKTQPFAMTIQPDVEHRVYLTRLKEPKDATLQGPAGHQYTADEFKGEVRDPANNVVAQFGVRQYRHGDGSRVPQTARWKWSAEDEEFWFRCDVGCCEAAALGDGGGEQPLRPKPPVRPRT